MRNENSAKGTAWPLMWTGRMFSDSSLPYFKKPVIFLVNISLSLYLITFGFLKHYYGDPVLFNTSFITAIICTLDLVFYHFTGKYKATIYIMVTAGSLHVFNMFIFEANFGYLWMYLFPLVTLYFLGVKRGFFLNCIAYMVILLFFVYSSKFPLVNNYSLAFQVRFALSFLFVLIFTFVFEYSGDKNRRALAIKNKELDEKLSELKVIQDELSKAHENLEKSVKNRTTELSTANEKLAFELREKSRIESELYQERNLLSTIINNLPDHIFVKNAKLEYVAINKALMEAQGIETIDEMVGKNDYQVFPEFRAYKFVKDDTDIIKSGKSMINSKERVLYPDGTERWYLTTKVPVYNENGEIKNIVGIARDITEISEKEEELRKSQKKYKETSQLLEVLFDSIPDVIGVQDIDHNVHRYNKAGYEFMGMDPESGETTKCYTLLGKTKECDECATMTVLQTKEPARAEKYIPEKGVWVDSRTYPILDDDGNVIRIIEHLRDITDYKNALLEIKESEQRFRTLFDFAPDAYFLCDLDGNIVDGNKAAEKILGVTRAAIGKNLLKDGFLHDSEYRKGLKFILKGRQGKPTGPTEFVLNRYDRTQFIAEVITHPVLLNDKKLILGIVRDISERKKAELILKESEEKFRLISENTGDLISVMTFVKDPVFKYASPSHEKKLGFQSEELVGKCVEDFIRPEDVSQIAPMLKSLMAQKDEAQKKGKIPKFTALTQYHFRDKLGKYHLLESTINTIKDDMVIVSRDITERKQQEDQIKDSLNEKEVLLQEIHHRVKNNLQIISSLLYLQSKNIDSPDVLGHLQDSQSRIKSMALIHEKLYQSKDFSNINFKFYLNSLAQNLLQTYNNQGATIDLSIKVDDVKLSLEKAIPCGLIVNELLTNSLKYAFSNEDSGKISVKLLPHNGKPDKKIYYKLIVNDNGVGLPNGFDFTKSKSLGLKLVKNLTMQLDGELSINGKSGTEFTIDFPAN